jgi:hypothetical protein
MLVNFKNKFLNIKYISVILLLLFSINIQADARGIPLRFTYGAEKMVKIQDLQSEKFALGAIYKQVALFGLPLWNYDKRLCGYIDNANYVELTKEQAAKIITDNNVKVPFMMGIPFWDLAGPKIILIIVIAGLFIYYSRKS